MSNNQFYRRYGNDNNNWQRDNMINLENYNINYNISNNSYANKYRNNVSNQNENKIGIRSKTHKDNKYKRNVQEKPNQEQLPYNFAHDLNQNQFQNKMNVMENNYVNNFGGGILTNFDHNKMNKNNNVEKELEKNILSTNISNIEKDILKFLIYIYFYEKSFKNNSYKFMKNEEEYYLINPEWLKGFKEHYSYDKIQKFLESQKNLSFYNIDININDIIRKLLSESRIDIHNEFKDLKNVNKINTTVNRKNNIVFTNEGRILPSKIMSIIKNLDKKLNQIILPKRFIFDNNLIYYINKEKIIIGNQNNFPGFKPLYVLAFNSLEKEKEEEKLLFLTSFNNYISQRKCNNAFGVQKLLDEKNQPIGTLLILYKTQPQMNQNLKANTPAKNMGTPKENINNQKNVLPKNDKIPINMEIQNQKKEDKIIKEKEINNNQINPLEQELKKKEEEIKNIKKNYFQIIKQKEELTKQYNNMIKQISSMKLELDKMRKNEENYSSQISENQKLIQELELREKMLTSENEQLKKQNEDYKEQISSLSKTRDNLFNNLSKTTIEQKSKKDDLINLNNQIIDLKLKLNNKDKEIENIKNDNVILMKEVERLEQNNKVMNEELNTTKAKMKEENSISIQKKENEAKNKINEKDKMINDINVKCESLEKENKDLSKQIDVLLKQDEKEKNILIKENDNLNKQLNDLKQEMKQKNEEISKNGKEIINNNLIKTELDKLKKENEILSEENQFQKEEIKTMKQMLEQMKEKEKTLLFDLNKKKEESKEKEKYFNKKKEENEQMVKFKTNLEKKNSELTNQINKLIEDKNKDEEEISNQKNEIINLNKELDKIKKDYDSLLIDNAKKDNKIIKMQSEIDQTKKDNINFSFMKNKELEINKKEKDLKEKENEIINFMKKSEELENRNKILENKITELSNKEKKLFNNIKENEEKISVQKKELEQMELNKQKNNKVQNNINVINNSLQNPNLINQQNQTNTRKSNDNQINNRAQSQQNYRHRPDMGFNGNMNNFSNQMNFPLQNNFFPNQNIGFQNNAFPNQNFNQIPFPNQNIIQNPLNPKSSSGMNPIKTPEPSPPKPKLDPIDFYKQPTLIGLNNIGSTCYKNAVLQCLSQTKGLTNYFLKTNNYTKIMNNNYSTKFKKELQLCPIYYDLIQKLWKKNSPAKSFSPDIFMNSIAEMTKNDQVQFSLYEAGDAKDFIIYILERMHNELKKPIKKEKKVGKIDSEQTLNQYDKNNALNFFLDEFQNDTSIISDLFYGFNETTNVCQYCKNSYNSKGQTEPICYNYGIFNILIFPLEEVRKYREQLMKFNNFNLNLGNMVNTVNLMECFFYNQKSDFFTGENKNYCNICRQLFDSVYTSKIFVSPNILIIILNRGKGNMFDVKIDFSEQIDISGFVLEKQGKEIYNLYGVITHLGQSGPNAHFIA